MCDELGMILFLGSAASIHISDGGGGGQKLKNGNNKTKTKNKKKNRKFARYMTIVYV